MIRNTESSLTLLTAEQAAEHFFQRLQQQVNIPRSPSRYHRYSSVEAAEIWWRFATGASRFPSTPQQLKEKLNQYDLRLDLSTHPARDYQVFQQALGRLVLQQLDQKQAQNDKLFGRR